MVKNPIRSTINIRVLLDENLDWGLVSYSAADLQGTTVSRQGWKGTRNSELFMQAAATFDALVTMDWILNINRTSATTLSVSCRFYQKNSLEDIQPVM